jgi:predicted ABC-class ATPase
LEAVQSRRGSGRSGELSLYAPGPEILERSALRLVDGHLELRLRIGLPARGRRILGKQAWGLVDQDLRALCAALEPGPGLLVHVESVRRQRALRRALEPAGLVAFVADGSVLPRESGVGSGPLLDAVPWQGPDTLSCVLETPLGHVRGTGIPKGITVIVGGGFHGKSTVLQALARGHLDHVPGDGREGVVALPQTVKIRAEDGRCVHGVDISSLLRGLPGGRSTRPFSTQDASGSTSQAASLVESVQAGARVLLMDEDTCATNLMVRDARMRALVPESREPITPLVERVVQMRDAWGLSMVFVIGGIGDYLGVADTVLSMEDYRPVDRSLQAQALGIVVSESAEGLVEPLARVLAGGLAPGRIKVRDERRVQLGDTVLELGGLEQIRDGAHAFSIARALVLCEQLLVERGPMDSLALVGELMAILSARGLEVLSPQDYPAGDLVQLRPHEVMAAIDRLRTLKLSEL